MRRTKSLVTGCAGFVGSHLTDRLLTSGHNVIGIDCFTDYYPLKIKKENIMNAVSHPNFTLINKDIAAMQDFPQVDYVFHLAAQAGVRASWGTKFKEYLRIYLSRIPKVESLERIQRPL